MKPAKTANPDSDTATAENGLHLMAALATGINRLHLSRSEMVELTRPANLSKLLASIREQPEAPITSIRTRTCTVSPRPYNEHSSWASEKKCLEAAPWIRYSDASNGDNPLSAEHFRKLKVEFPNMHGQDGLNDYNLTSVFQCEVTANKGWAIEVFRDAFQFYGPEKHLARALLARNTVWSFGEIMSLLANIVHNPDNDPLGLQELDRGALFPVLTSSLFDEDQTDWRKVDTDKILSSITWLDLRGRCGMHLGKNQWGFRIFCDMKYAFSKRLGEHDVALGKDRHSLILFRDDPRPRSRKGASHEQDYPEIYGE